MPEVSVITPARLRSDQEAAWFKEAVQSVLSQDADWEMVIVNDGSSVPFEPLRDWFPDRRIRWFRTEGVGAPSARNWAARYASSKLLLPLDADDKFAPGAIAKYLAAWKRAGRGFVYPDVMMFGDDFQRVRAMADYNFEFLLKRTFICIGALLLKSDWEKVRGYNPKMVDGLEDWEFYVKLGESGVCGTRIPEPLYWYRQAPAGRTAELKSDREKWHRAYDTLRELHRDTYNGRWPMGCCGGSGRAGSQTVGLRGIRRTPAAGITEPIQVEYIGRRGGRFGVTGRNTGRRYQILNSGAVFTVEAKDVPGLLAMRVFRVVPTPIPGEEQVAAPTPRPRPAPGPKPAPEPEPELPDEKWGALPEPGEAEAEAEAGAEAIAIPDPGLPDIQSLSVRAIRAIEFPAEQLEGLWLQEQVGKQRKTVLEYLETLMDEVADSFLNDAAGVLGTWDDDSIEQDEAA